MKSEHCKSCRYNKLILPTPEGGNYECLEDSEDGCTLEFNGTFSGFEAKKNPQEDFIGIELPISVSEWLEKKSISDHIMVDTLILMALEDCFDLNI